MYEIRKVTPKDKAQVIELVMKMRSGSHYVRYAPNHEKIALGMIRWIGADEASAMMFVADLDGKLVGFLAASIAPHWGSDDLVATENLFFVDEAHRKIGVGKQLFTAFMSWSQKYTDHIQAGAWTGTGEGLDRLCENMGMHKTGSTYTLHLNE